MSLGSLVMLMKNIEIGGFLKIMNINCFLLKKGLKLNFYNNRLSNFIIRLNRFKT